MKHEQFFRTMEAAMEVKDPSDATVVRNVLRGVVGSLEAFISSETSTMVQRRWATQQLFALFDKTLRFELRNRKQEHVHEIRKIRTEARLAKFRAARAKTQTEAKRVAVEKVKQDITIDRERRKIDRKLARLQRAQKGATQ